MTIKTTSIFIKRQAIIKNLKVYLEKNIASEPMICKELALSKAELREAMTLLLIRSDIWNPFNDFCPVSKTQQPFFTTNYLMRNAKSLNKIEGQGDGDQAEK